MCAINDPLGQTQIFARGSFQNLAKQNNFQMRIVIATGWTVGRPRGSIQILVLTNFCIIFVK